MKKQLAIFAITKKGAQKASYLHSKIGGSLFLPEKFQKECPENNAFFFPTPTSVLIKELFRDFEKVIGFCALGIMVRLIAPHLKTKKKDPAVVVLDEAGKFAISVVSGHMGGANKLAVEVADILGAVPVVTTASDVSRTLAVDLLGREFGWGLENEENVTRVSAAVINGEKVAMAQTCGEEGWRRNGAPLPSNIVCFSSLEDALRQKPSALLLITDLIVDEKALGALGKSNVIYRPKSLVVGVGCNKGTPTAELEDAILYALKKNRLSQNCIRSLATIDLKKGEPAISAFGRKYNVPIFHYKAADLNGVINIPNPSEYAMKHAGALGVAEPAAMLQAGAATLLQEKIISGNVTVALARVNSG